MNKKYVKWILCLLLPLSLKANASVLTLNVEAGDLVGVSNLTVGSNLYDVSFIDGTCIELFSGCDEVSDFLFSSVEEGQQAGQALLDFVFNEENSTFDDSPSLTRGCEVSTCNMIIPYAEIDFQGNFSRGNTDARNYPLGGPEDSVGITGTQQPDFDYAQSPSETWAVFQLVDVVPPNPVNAPSGSILFITMLLTLTFARTLKKNC